MYNYNDMRDVIEDGDIVFFRDGGLVSRFIQIMTGRFNHVGMAVWGDVLDKDRLFILEETPSGRRLNNMSLRCSKVRAYRGPVDDYDLSDPLFDALTFYADNTGAPYSLWNAVVGGLGLPRSWRQDGKNICSQLSARFIRDAFGVAAPDQHPSKQEKFCAKFFTEVKPESFADEGQSYVDLGPAS